TTLKAEGWFVSQKNKKFCKFIVRLQAFAGKSFVKVYHTFIYTGYPENKEHYLYKIKKLPANETIQAIYIETPLLFDDTQFSMANEAGEFIEIPAGKSINIKQVEHDKFSIEGLDENIIGRQLKGWFDVSGKDRGLSIVMKDLWQQFPKGWDYDTSSNKLITHIWPAWAPELDLKTTPSANGTDAVGRGSAFGLGKTHEMSFYFHDKGFTNADEGNVVNLLETTTLLSAAPKWVSDTLAIGKISPYRSKAVATEGIIESLFDWAQRQPKDSKWYGMIDYGDVRTWHHEKDGEHAWHLDGRQGWMGNEIMGLSVGCFYQYLRTGQYKYLEFGEDAALHVMDIDTVHYNTVANDKRLKKITDAYSQVGSQHRHNADHWGGRNEETSHTNLHGTLLYYYMTGNERAFDVAKEIGGFFLKEKITYFRHPDIAPQRNIGNILWGAVDMYEATGEQKYKTLADKYADVLFKGQNYDGSWADTYNPMSRRWSGKPSALHTLEYTLPALIAYHRLTKNKAIAKAIVDGTSYFSMHKPYNPFFEALSYSYYLTNNVRFLELAQDRLDVARRGQRHNDNPLEDGMIYQKAFFMRPIEFLYHLPFVLDLVK
ncbi:MAG: hypothetical protein ACI9E5_000210, partial [Candidatus Omnitrophota bacterium]